MDFFDLLQERQSVRKFLPEQISQPQLERLLLAANRAPVGSNRYGDVHLTVVQDKTVLQKLSQAAQQRFSAMPRNNQIFGSLKPGAVEVKQQYDPFYGAPTVIFASHRRQNLQPGIEFCNVACLVYSMHLAAQAMGLGSVFMWFALESIRLLPDLDCTALLQLPTDFEPLLGLAVGYPAKLCPVTNPSADKISRNYI